MRATTSTSTAAATSAKRTRRGTRTRSTSRRAPTLPPSPRPFGTTGCGASAIGLQVAHAVRSSSCTGIAGTFSSKTTSWATHRGAWRTAAGLAGQPDVNRPRNITFRNNQFYAIRDYAAADAGAITKPITAGISFIDNYFARSAFLADKGPPSPPGYRGPPVYTGNTLIDVGDIQRLPTATALPYNTALNTVASAPHGYDSYERKRWTGPERARGAIPATHLRTHDPPDPPPRQIG